MFKKVLVAVSLILFSTFCFGASSAKLMKDRNCRIWAAFAEATVDGKNVGKTKEEILNDFDKSLKEGKVEESAINQVKEVMGHVYDNVGKDVDGYQAFAEMYAACMTQE